MPLVPTNTSRPSLPYAPKQSLPNNTRFEILTATQRPPTAEMLDAEFNALTDDINMLAEAINDTAAGVLPGANNLANINKFPTTDGQNHINWTLVGDQNIGDQSITTRTVQDGAITTPKLGAAAVDTTKIASKAVKTTHIDDEGVTTVNVKDKNITLPKLANTTNGAVLGADNTGVLQPIAGQQNQLLISQGGNIAQFGKIADANITPGGIGNVSLSANAVATANMQNVSVTAAKINPTGGAIGTVLTAGNGTASWAAIPTTGKILQVVQYQYNDITRTQNSTTFVSFDVPFKVTITPQKATSYILVYLSVNLAGFSGVDDCVHGLLCKNDAPWQESIAVNASGVKATFGFMQSGTESGYTMRNYSGMFIDTNHNTNEITYELKAFNRYLMGTAKSVKMNSSATNTQVDVGVSSIYAIEIDL
jgi:hypothetical protein